MIVPNESVQYTEAISDSHQRLEEGWVKVHLLLWKHTTATLVRVDTEVRAQTVTQTLRGRHQNHASSAHGHAVWHGAWQ